MKEIKETVIKPGSIVMIRSYKADLPLMAVERIAFHPTRETTCSWFDSCAGFHREKFNAVNLIEVIL